MQQKWIGLVLGTALSALGMTGAIAQPESNWIEPMHPPQVNHDSIIDYESDPAVETRNLQAEFRGTDLTSEQFEQIRLARRQFRAELKQIMTEDLGSLLQLVFLPQPQAEQAAVQVLENPLMNYSAALSEILTPEQLRIWQQNVEQASQNNSQSNNGFDCDDHDNFGFEDSDLNFD